MAVTLAYVIGTGTGVDQASYTVNINSDANTLYVVMIEASRTGSTNPATPTFTHNAIVATEIASLLWVTTGVERRKIWLFGWDSGAGSGGAMTATADFGVTHHGCSLTVAKGTGTDIGNGLVQTFVQSVTTATDLTGTSGSLTFAAEGHADNRPLAFFIHAANEESTQEASWSPISNVAHANPNTGIKGEWRSTLFDTTATMSWTTSSAYGGLGVEVKAAAAPSGGEGLSPVGSMGFFGA